jgi:chemotaxis protein histidine kinase CheA
MFSSSMFGNPFGLYGRPYQQPYGYGYPPRRQYYDPYVEDEEDETLISPYWGTTPRRQRSPPSPPKRTSHPQSSVRMVPVFAGENDEEEAEQHVRKFNNPEHVQRSSRANLQQLEKLQRQQQQAQQKKHRGREIPVVHKSKEIRIEEPKEEEDKQTLVQQPETLVQQPEFSIPEFSIPEKEKSESPEKQEEQAAPETQKSEIQAPSSPVDVQMNEAPQPDIAPEQQLSEEEKEEKANFEKINQISNKVNELGDHVQILRDWADKKGVTEEEKKFWLEIRKAEELLTQQLLLLDSIIGSDEVRKQRKEQVLRVQSLLSDIDNIRNITPETTNTESKL